MPTEIQLLPTTPTTSDNDAGVVTYGLLSQKNDDYDPKLLAQLDDLYRGGYAMVRKADIYLHKLVNESPDRYAERCASTSYQPYFGQIVDQFVADLFGQPLSIKPAADAADPNTPGELPDDEFYTAFEKDVDLEGTSFLDLMECTMRTALKKRYALVAVDAPEDKFDTPPASLDDAMQRGSMRCYAYEVPLEQLIDWKCAPGGKRFAWAILNKREMDRPTPFSRRNAVKETFTVWSLPEGSDHAEWKRYVIVYDEKQPPKPDDPLTLESEGASSFSEIPLLRFELPEGLWVGNKIGPQAREHYQRRSSLVGAENRSMVAIPYIKKGAEGPAVGGEIPAQVTQNTQRGNNPVARFNAAGWFEIGANDEVGFLEPDGGCYELVDKQLDNLKDGMFAVNHQMAASIRPTGAALGRSGLSKQKDQDATERVLRALGAKLRDFAVRIYDVIAKARDEDVHWTPHGLDNYDHEDREELLQEAITVDQIAIPSITFKKIHKRVLAEKLLRGAVDVETMAQILKEIEDGVDDEQDMRDIQTEAQKQAILNPEIPPVGVKTPSVKAPAVKAPQAPGVQAS